MIDLNGNSNQFIFYSNIKKLNKIYESKIISIEKEQQKEDDINQNNNINSSQYKISNNINESIIDELKNEKIKNKLLEEKYNKLNLLFEQKIKAMENELTNEKNKNLLIEEKYKSIQIESEKKIKSLEKILNEEKNKNQLLDNKLKE